ncbi:hypothetical protein [Hymenobacter siberiensis]|uniref:hypothetical protein n=1 Tax=Hymenobacter siberiensis TaxID=2848396 RepID=UPI001C1E0073|nr:hypothetical protein [Hymenobacter siberiensis]
MKETKLTISNKKMKVDLPLVEQLTPLTPILASVLAPETLKSLVATTIQTEPAQALIPLRALVYDGNTKQMALGKFTGGVDTSFDGTRQITRDGLPHITPGGITVGDVLENLLYPAVGPGASLSVVDPVRLMGATPTVVMNWNVTQQTNPITEIVVNGIAQDITLTSGSESVLTYNSTDATYYMSVATATEAATASASVNFRHNRIWFTATDDKLGYFDKDLSNSLNALSSGNKEFATSRQMTKTFTLNDEYIYFAYLESYGPATFVVGGLPNTAYVSKTFTFANENGYDATFLLYRSGGKGTGSIGVQLN